MAPPIQFYGRLVGKLAASVAIICTAAVVGISDLEDTVPMLVVGCKWEHAHVSLRREHPFRL